MTIRAVGPGKTYAKIQDAVNASSSHDVIEVYSGTYNEAVTMKAGVQYLTITAAAGQLPVMVGTGKSFAFRWVTEPDVEIVGFEIRGYHGDGTSGVLQGSGWGCVAKDCYIHDCNQPAMTGAYGLSNNHAELIRCRVLATRGGVICSYGSACSGWNNLIVPQAGYSGVSYPTDSNGIWDNNTVVVDGAPCGLDTGAGAARNNIVTGSGTTGIHSTSSSYNTAHGFAVNHYQAGSQDQTTDPLLTADYRITPESHCYNYGTTIATVPTDLEGTARPYGAAYDRGCYEFVPPTPDLSLPSGFTPFPPAALAPGYRIRKGSGPSAPGEQVLAQNVNFCIGYHAPPRVLCPFSSDAGYLQSSGTYGVRAFWKLPCAADLTSLSVTVRCNNSGDEGNITFGWRTAGTGTDLTIPSGGDQVVTGTLPAADATDTLEMALESPDGGVIKVYSVEVHAVALAALPVGRLDSGAMPIDEQEVDGDAPLSTYLRYAEFYSLDQVRKTRQAVLVSFADDVSVRSNHEALKTTSDEYTVVAHVSVPALRGAYAITGFVSGKRTGTVGNVRFRTKRMATLGTSVQVALTVSGSYVAPYPLTLIDDLEVGDNTNDSVEVAIQSDGTNIASIHSLTLWAKVA